MSQSLEIVISTVVEAVAIGPLVVAGNVYHGLPQLLEHLDRGLVDVVGTFRTAVFDITVVERKGDVGRVHVGNQRGHLRLVLGLGIGHVAPEPERERRTLRRRRRREDGRGQHNGARPGNLPCVARCRSWTRQVTPADSSLPSAGASPREVTALWLATPLPRRKPTFRRYDGLT